MNDPVYTLIIGIVIVLFFAVLLWPDRGLIAKWRKLSRQTQRVQIEDALKHLYDFEYKNIGSTLQSLAGYLSLSGDETAKLAERVKNMGLIVSKDEQLKLTSAGRVYALKIIRIHRLWEKYLADETGIQEKDWHINAEEKEHFLNDEKVNKLAAKMGNPAFDPHGDPIPSAEGELPVKKGVPLTELKTGDFCQIVHIEDEPNTIYSQIIAAGLFPGMQLEILETEPDKIVLSAEGEERILSPLIAANITVVKLKNEETSAVDYTTLSSLKIGEEAVVQGISKACRAQQRRRLMDLGIVPGTIIKAELESIGKDPVAYNVRGASIALRKNQADQIYITKLNKAENDNE